MDRTTGLNPSQAQAVLHTDGALLILAGAGSGKTRVLTHRIAHLMDSGVRPENILAVTFTNKAAEEMRVRVDRLAGGKSTVWISTFHAMCARILRMEAHVLGLPPAFGICDDDDQKAMLRQCCAACNLDEKKYSPQAIRAIIGRAKDDLIGVQEFAQQTEQQNNAFLYNVSKVYAVYDKMLTESGNLDFGDLQFKTVQLLQTFPEVLKKYNERFHYIMVDEYQDTNHAQYTLVTLLTGDRKNVCVVGDDDQSIYSWRGATIRNILEFEKDFYPATIVRLEQNYRSTQLILDAAWKVVRNNHGRKEKKLWTEQHGGDPVLYWQAHDEIDEAWQVAREIDRLTGVGFSFRDMAILYRTNAQSRVLEDILRKAEIPYIIVGNVRFYDRKEIRDVLCYLRVLVNQKDSISFKRIINVPARGIGDTSIKQFDQLRADGESMFDVITNIRNGMYQDTLDTRLTKSATALYELFTPLMAAAREHSASDVARMVLERTQYFEKLEDDVTKEARIENVRELISAIKDYEVQTGDITLEGFLAHTALMTDFDTVKRDEEYVTLMTLHLAKGLEFPAVFITGLEEGLFPHSSSDFDLKELEEERRLCYVGMTRAKQHLYLLSASQRNVFGKTRWCFRSRFIKEAGLPVDDFSVQEPRKEYATSVHSDRERVSDDVAFSDEPTTPIFYINDRVKHPTFGVGVIEEVQGASDSAITVVRFFSGHTKRLMAKYAKLEKCKN